MQSFPPELQETLRPLLPLLPLDKATLLKDCLEQATSEEIPQIPYDFILELSRWVQTHPDELPPDLRPERYTMIALLAGSVASPRSRFPPPPPPAAARGRETISQTTREITTLLNCAITIVGAGFGAWFASFKAGWRNEWVSSSSCLYYSRVEWLPANSLCPTSIDTRGSRRDRTLYRLDLAKRTQENSKAPSSLCGNGKERPSDHIIFHRH
jgi:hypothetical protein